MVGLFEVLGRGVGKPLDDGGFDHVDNSDEPVRHVDLRGVLAEEQENVCSVGGGDAGVEVAGAREGDVVGGEAAGGDIHGENVVLGDGRGKEGG